MRYAIAGGCVGILLLPVVVGIILYAVVMVYSNPRIGEGEHFPFPTYPISQH